MASIRKHNQSREHKLPRERRRLVKSWRSPLLRFCNQKKKKSKLETRHKSKGISVLPMECLAHILSFTTPRDACASSLVSSIFRSAADCDEIWEKFLPWGYKDIVAKLSLNLDSFSSKKDLFFRLCGAPILLDGGTKSLTIDNKTGKISLFLGSKELMISWDSDIEWTNESSMGQSVGYTREIIDHWRWIPISNARFPEAIELVSDGWHQISGKVDMKSLTSNTNYSVYIVFKLAEYSVGFELEDNNDIDACGSADAIVHFVRGEGSASGMIELLIGAEYEPRANTFNTPHQNENESEDDWIEVKLGQFYNDQAKDGQVEMILLDGDDAIWSSRLWMAGFVVQGIEIRPDDNKNI